MKVLLAIDDSLNSRAATASLLQRDWPEGTQVKVISVVEPIAPVLEIPFGDPRATASEMCRQVQDELLEATDGLAQICSWQLAEKFGDENVSYRAIGGRIAETILKESEEWAADLVVVGSHGRTALKRLFLGSVSRAILLHAKCSVEIVKIPGEFSDNDIGKMRSPRKILVPLDFSIHSASILDTIAGNKWSNDTEFLLLNVVKLYANEESKNGEMGALALILDKDNLKYAALELELYASRLRKKLDEGKVEIRCETGDARSVIIDVAGRWNADLIVMGSHGRSGVARIIFGSVSEYVVGHSKVPVQIVRIPDQVSTAGVTTRASSSTSGK
jgi:nucleotide-binding universal stress UspA family protein